MIQQRFRGIIFAGLTAFFLLSCQTVPVQKKNHLQSVLPEKFEDGWIAEGAVSLYTPDTLYEHIDGEAMLYEPYDFQLCASRTYCKEGASIEVDIYQMGSSLNSFGIYSNYRREDGDFIPIGAECSAGETQLVFYIGSYFIRITGVSIPGNNRSPLENCARLIARKLSVSCPVPEEVTVLSRALGISSQKIAYIPASALGYDFFSHALVADMGVKNNSYRILICFTDSPADATDVVDAYKAYLTASNGKYRLVNSLLVASDPLYHHVIIQKEDNMVLGLIGEKTPSLQTSHTILSRMASAFRKRQTVK